MSIPAPNKIWNLGHPQAKDLLLDHVTCTEKVDGSYASFSKDEDGRLHVRSKGQVFPVEAPNPLFALMCETAQRLSDQLVPGWIYRGEAFCKPKHNTLAYDRMPRGGFILFDIVKNRYEFLNYEEQQKEADRLGLEIVPLLFQGKLENSEKFRELLETTSILGGQLIEGVVIKNYSRFGQDGYPLMGKYVSERFKENHRQEWKKSNPSAGDILDLIRNAYTTPARWDKALIHLKEAGTITNSPKDIGPLIKEVNRDITEECKEEIKDMLWTWARKKIFGGFTNGLPEWYKNKLVNEQFENND